MESVILEEDIDEDYEPTDAEIDEYAQWLGLTDDDVDLHWIAREGLKAPLPDHWKPCKTSEGEIYYFNFSTGESVWDHPCDEYYRNLYEEEKAKKARSARETSTDKKRREAAKKGAPGASLGPAPGSIGSQPLSKLTPLGGEKREVRRVRCGG